MAHVERPTFTQAVPPNATIRTIDGEPHACWPGRDGKQVRALILPNGRCRRTVSNKWVGRYRDHRGVKAQTPPFGDRNHALQTAILLEKQAQAIREGRATVGRTAGKVLLLDVLPDHIAYMKREGFAPTHVQGVENLIRRVIVAHELTTAGRVDAERLAAGLEKDRLAGRKEGAPPFSLRTRNWWTATLKAFGAWLVETKRTDTNPFTDLPLVNAKKDRRHVRRPLDVGDLSKLVAAARDGGDYYHITGPDRAALYTLAMYSGLRAGALFKLTPESFRWKGDVLAAVYSTARGQKAGEDHGIPIAPAVAKDLGDWLKGKPAGQPLFRRPTKSRPRTSRIIQHDLAAAGLPFRGPDGRVIDFHALRMSFGVTLAKSGVPLVMAQQLMQHSTPVLTANVYSQVGGELADEVAKLPPLTPNLGADLGADHLRSRPPVGKSNEKTGRAKTKKPHGSR